MNYKKAIPFLDQGTLDEVFDILVKKERYAEITEIAYALSAKKVEELFHLYVEKDIDPSGLLPFVSSSFLREMVLAELEKME